MVLESTCSARWVLLILPNQPVRNQWNYQEKMERHFPVKKKKNSKRIKRPFTVRPKFEPLLGKVGLETRIFGNDKARPVKEDHLWR